MKNCKHEDKEIDSQLKKKKKKKKRKRNMVFATTENEIQYNLYIVICKKINENNHRKLSYNPKYIQIKK